MKHNIYSSDTPGKFGGKKVNDSRIGASFSRKSQIAGKKEFICHPISKNCAFVPMVMFLSLLVTMCTLLRFIYYFHSSNDKAVFTNDLPQLMRTSFRKEANITKFPKKEKVPFVLHYSWKEATLSSSWNQCNVDNIKYYNDEDVDKFVKQHRPSYYPSFQEKLSKIEKMWNVFLLWTRGYPSLAFPMTSTLHHSTLCLGLSLQMPKKIITKPEYFLFS
mmetsp:Transcript_23835/g.34165  ORF Transcript_23835/g.34165 Transcript_23835/m.34165 type:complete len:218 (-) Transcript_23835:410-1063(-)